MPVRSLLKSRITALNRDMRDLPRALIGDKRHGQNGPKGLPYPPPTMLALGTLAPRGACLHTALIDNATKKLYVANLGDCRVVGGWYSLSPKVFGHSGFCNPGPHTLYPYCSTFLACSMLCFTHEVVQTTSVLYPLFCVRSRSGL